jgi:3-hydroxyisobutyrate dehydrogenase
MAAGGIVAIHSTIHPRTVRRLDEIAADRGIAVVDAPVSGGAPAVAEGRLLVMVGGPSGAVARCRTVFEAFGDPILHLGGVGSGQTAKALNNLVFTVQVGIALETYAFADGVGMDRSALAEVLAHGSGGSRAAAIVASSGFDTTGISGAAPLLRKDVDIALDVAKAAGAPSPAMLAELADAALGMLVTRGTAQEEQ